MVSAGCTTLIMKEISPVADVRLGMVCGDLFLYLPHGLLVKYACSTPTYRYSLRGPCARAPRMVWTPSIARGQGTRPVLPFMYARGSVGHE